MQSLRYEIIDKYQAEALYPFLQENGIHTDDLPDSNAEFIVVRNKHSIVGCIAIERYKNHGLLRSFAVAPSYRNKGLGNILLQKLVAHSKQHGIKDIHLLTTTAEDFFVKRGFTKSGREKAPEAIQKTTEFASVCPADAVYLTQENIENKAILYTPETREVFTDSESNAQYWSVQGKNLMFSYFEVPPYSTFTEHTHKSEQITHVLEGKLFFSINGEIFTVEKDGTIVVPSNVPHSVWTQDQAAKAVDSWSPINPYFAS